VTLAPAEADRITGDLTALAEYADPGLPGWSRRALGEPYRESRPWVERLMREAGLEVSRDAAGNLRGRLPGRRPGAGALVTGSHTDSVVGGGRFDGVVGVLGAIEAVRVLRESGVRLEHDLVVVDFYGEETNDYGFGCLGSRAATEGLEAELLDRVDDDGVPLHARLTAHDIDPAGLLAPAWRPGEVAAFVELHVEQGPQLAEQGVPVGVVTAVTGIERLVATFHGRRDHAGTRAMTDRRDAMVAAARAVLAIQRVGCEAPVHGVATTTHLDNPNPSPNVVAAEVTMASELRSVDEVWLSGARRQIAEQVVAEAQAGGVDVELDWTTDNAVVRTDEVVQGAVSAVLDEAGVPWVAMPSGATHDAVHVARVAPAGMIFIPSRNGGVSHSPDELSDPADIALGVDTLAATLRRLDREVGR